MKRNIAIYAFFGMLVFCCLATPANAQTLRADTIQITYLQIGDQRFPLDDSDFNIISITLPSSQKPFRMTFYTPHPTTGDPTIKTYITTLPVILEYVPKP